MSHSENPWYYPRITTDPPRETEAPPTSASSLMSIIRLHGLALQGSSLVHASVGLNRSFACCRFYGIPHPSRLCTLGVILPSSVQNRKPGSNRESLAGPSWVARNFFVTRKVYVFSLTKDICKTTWEKCFIGQNKKKQQS